MARRNVSEALRAGGQAITSFADTLAKMGKEEEEARLRKLQEELLGFNVSKAKAEVAEGEIAAKEKVAQRAAGTEAGLLSERILGGENALNLGAPRGVAAAPGMEISVPTEMAGEGSQFNLSKEEMLARHATKAAKARGEDKIFTPEEFVAKREEEETAAKLRPLKLKAAEQEIAAGKLTLEEGRKKIQKLDAELKSLAAGGLDPEKAATIEEKLRKEYIAQNKDFQSVGDAYGRISAAGKDPSAAGDLALIFNYMKMLDPGSVVRESEFATAKNAGSVDERVRATYNNVLRGEKLSPEQRADFIERAGKLYVSAQDGYNLSRTAYSDLATKYKVNPERVIIDLTRTSSNAAPVEVWDMKNGKLVRVQ